MCWGQGRFPGFPGLWRGCQRAESPHRQLIRGHLASLGFPRLQIPEKGDKILSSFPLPFPVRAVPISLFPPLPPSFPLPLPPAPFLSPTLSLFFEVKPCEPVSWSLSPPLNGNPDPLPRHLEAPFPLQIRTLRALGCGLHVFCAPSGPQLLGSASPLLGPPRAFRAVARQGP